MRSKQSGEFAGRASILAAVAAGVMLLLPGCRPPAREATRRAVVAPRVATRDCDPSIDDEARRAAMVSVYVQAYSDAGLLQGATAQDLRVLDIKDAVRTLNRDCDPLAAARRRRAIAKLAAYGREKDPSASAWRALADDPGLIDKIADLLRLEPLHSPFEPLQSKLFDQAGSLTGECRAQVSDAVFQGPVLDPRSGVVSWEVSFTVQQTLDWLAPRLDPQNWDRCGPFFAATKYTTDVPSRVPSCTAAPTANPSENDPKTPGSAPYQATLFEHYTCAACQTEAETLLRISTAHGSCLYNPCDSSKGMDPKPAHQICYDLPCSGSERTACGNPPVGQTDCCSNALYFCVGTPATHMDLTIDQGDLTACNLTSGSGLRAIARKNVKFTSAWANWQTFFLYYVGQQAAIDGFVDIACCDLQ